MFELVPCRPTNFQPSASPVSLPFLPTSLTKCVNRRRPDLTRVFPVAAAPSPTPAAARFGPHSTLPRLQGWPRLLGFHPGAAFVFRGMPERTSCPRTWSSEPGSPAAVIGPADRAPAGSALQLADCRERKWPVSRGREETVVPVGDSPQSPSRASVLQPSVMDVAPGAATCPWCRQHVAGQPGGRACLGPHRRQAFAP